MSLLYGIDFEKLKGPKDALKWNRRDLPALETVIDMVPQRRVAVQAGGNLGVWPKRLAQQFETVYTFEPSPEMFPLLTRNAPEANIFRFQAALGNGPAMVGLSSRRRDGSGRPDHVGLTHVSGDGVVPVLTLDAFAFPVVDLLYLDLEGFELFALRGAVETLQRCRPVVAVEINKNAAFVGVDQDDLRAEITGWGYRRAARVGSDDVWVPSERVA